MTAASILLLNGDTAVRGAPSLSFPDHPCCTFRNRDRGSIRIAAGDRGHDRRVRDPEARHTVNTERRVHDGAIVHTHRAGSDRVPARSNIACDEFAQGAPFGGSSQDLALAPLRPNFVTLAG